jgi:hypothetical protein
MPPVEFEPTIQASGRPQTYALDCKATGTEIQTKHINTLYGQNVEVLNVKLAVRTVTTGL